MTQAQIEQIIFNSIFPYATASDFAKKDPDLYKSIRDATTKAAAAILEAMPKWISVRERLPGKDEDVLIYMQHHIHVGYHRDDYWHYTASEGRQSIHKHHFDSHYISHWQPLPNPPHASLPGDLKGESEKE